MRHGPLDLVVDYLQIMGMDGRAANRTEEVSSHSLPQ
jgi:replicative DNA helicase